MKHIEIEWWACDEERWYKLFSDDQWVDRLRFKTIEEAKKHIKDNDIGSTTCGLKIRFVEVITTETPLERMTIPAMEINEKT